MGRTYRVVDCKPALGAPGEIMQLAGSPEEAARLALGLSLHRGGHIRDLRAKVYLDAGGTVSMYRLYTRSLHEPNGEHAP